MAASDPITPESHRFSIRLPRPLWTGVAAVVLVVGAVGLRVGLPIYRQQLATQEIERRGGSFRTQEMGPAWLRRAFGDKRARFCEPVTVVYLNTTDWTDADMVHLEELTMLQELDLSNNLHLTDVGVQHIEELSRLKKLYLHGTIISKTWIADATRKHPGLVVYANGSIFR